MEETFLTTTSINPTCREMPAESEYSSLRASARGTERPLGGRANHAEQRFCRPRPFSCPPDSVWPCGDIWRCRRHRRPSACAPSGRQYHAPLQRLLYPLPSSDRGRRQVRRLWPGPVCEAGTSTRRRGDCRRRTDKGLRREAVEKIRQSLLKVVRLKIGGMLADFRLLIEE